MSLPVFNEDLNIIAALGDEPNLDDGLTANQLKAKFDEAANKIKAYINGDLKSTVDGLANGTGLANKAVKTAKIDDHAVTKQKIALGAVDHEKLALQAVYEQNIAPYAVTGGKIASGAVTPAKTTGLQMSIKQASCTINAENWTRKIVTVPTSYSYYVARFNFDANTFPPSHVKFIVKPRADVNFGPPDESLIAEAAENLAVCSGVRFELVNLVTVASTLTYQQATIIAHGWQTTGHTVDLDVFAIPDNALVSN